MKVKDATMQAYPFIEPAPDDAIKAYHPGMTLRDYFAAKALQGFIGTIFEEDMNFDQVANFVYGYADAMLKAREQ